MKNFALALGSIAFLFVVFESAEACWCRRDPAEKPTLVVAKELRRSLIVFSGEAVERNKSGLRFRVERVWKGEATSEIIFGSRLHAERGSEESEVFIDSCALLFDVGKKYLVYAYRERDELFVSKCSRTRLLESADKDIIELNKLKAKLSRVMGNRVSWTAKSNNGLQRTRR